MKKSILKTKSLTFIYMNMLIFLLILTPKSFTLLFDIIPIRLFYISVLIGFFLIEVFITKTLKLNNLKAKNFVIIYSLFLISTIPSLFLTKNILLSIYALVKFVMFGMVLFIFAKIKLEKRDYKTIAISFVIAAIIVMIGGIIQYVFSINLNYLGIEKYLGMKGRIYFTFFNPIYYGIFINCIFAYILYLFKQRIIKTKIMIPFITLLYLALVLTFTRSALLVFWGIIAICLILNPKFILNKIYISILLLCIIFNLTIPGAKYVATSAVEYGIQLAGSEQFREYFSINFGSKANPNFEEIQLNDSSLESRKNFIGLAKIIARDHPLTGVGFGAYTDYLFSSEFAEKYSKYNEYRVHPHSGFILMVAEVGYLSSLLFIITLSIIFYKLLSFTYTAYKSKSNIYQLCIVSIATFMGFIVTSYIAESSFYDTQVFPIFLSIIGLTINYLTKINNFKK